MTNKKIRLVDNFLLDNKLAVVTGGGTGIGFAISQTFINAGAKVVITGRRKDVLSEAVAKLGPDAKYITCDIRDLEKQKDTVSKIENDFGPVDILVNNAGINLKKNALEVTNKEFLDIITTNLVGLFVFTREVAAKMTTRHRGSIINITSMAALYGIPGVTAYSASKTGLLGLTRSLAVDLSPFGIRINAIAPGFIESPMLMKAMNSDPGRKQKVLERTPMKTFGQPEDISNAALYLASDASKFITGVNIPVDGGNSIGF